ncbi:tetratricopeptide repeat protein [Microbacterium maritypicum]
MDSARLLLLQASAFAGARQSVWANLGMVSLDMDDYLAAIDAYGKADQDAVQVRVNRGLAFERIGERDRARQEYLAALELQPGELDALVNLGTLELEANQIERARTLLTRAVEIDPMTNWQLIDLWVRTGSLIRPPRPHHERSKLASLGRISISRESSVSATNWSRVRLPTKGQLSMASTVQPKSSPTS